MEKENDKKVKERERKKTTHLDLSTEGEGGQKTHFNREHEYLSSLGGLGFLFASGAADMWVEGEVGGLEEP